MRFSSRAEYGAGAPRGSRVKRRDGRISLYVNDGRALCGHEIILTRRNVALVTGSSQGIGLASRASSKRRARVIYHKLGTRPARRASGSGPISRLICYTRRPGRTRACGGGGPG
jgi:hypothetical protein